MKAPNQTIIARAITYEQWLRSRQVLALGNAWSAWSVFRIPVQSERARCVAAIAPSRSSISILVVDRPTPAETMLEVMVVELGSPGLFGDIFAPGGLPLHPLANKCLAVLEAFGSTVGVFTVRRPAPAFVGDAPDEPPGPFDAF